MYFNPVSCRYTIFMYYITNKYIKRYGKLVRYIEMTPQNASEVIIVWLLCVNFRFECDCSGTGFAGPICEEEILECVSEPCQHGATCHEGINQYACQCWPGNLLFYILLVIIVA